MRRRIVLFVILALFILGAAPARSHFRAAAVLRRFAETATVTEAESHAPAVEEQRYELAGHGRARLYAPRGQSNAPGLVLLHGIHRLGVDEPRLIRFARALAENGVAVLTPEVRELADYRLDPRSIDTIGAAARDLRAKLGRKVGVMGMSFAGGLSLLAASDPRFAPDIALVIAVGAHDDAARVCRFFATNRIENVDGNLKPFAAHDYGMLVFVYAHAEHFFPEEDAARARRALFLWLAEKRDEARAEARELGDASSATLSHLFDHHLDALAPRFLKEIDVDRDALGAVSPHGRLADVRVPVFLLHGSGDTVIPSTETEWLAREVPPKALRDVLISPAVVHIEISGKPTLSDQWSLVHFLASALGELEAISR